MQPQWYSKLSKHRFQAWPNGITLNDVGTIQNVTCGQSNGSITGIQVSGATQYQWFDQSDQLIATTTDPNLRDVKAGSYYLVAANSSCKKASQLYTVGGDVAVVVNNDHVQIDQTIDTASPSDNSVLPFRPAGIEQIKAAPSVNPEGQF